MHTCVRILLHPLHQFATILLWVGTWNLLDLIIDKKDVTVNAAIVTFTLIIWQVLSTKYYKL